MIARRAGLGRSIVGRTFVASGVLFGFGCNSFDEAPADGPQLFIPTDDRPATRATVRPVAIGGGTLHVTSDGAFAVAADEDRDRIAVVDLSGPAVASTLHLEAGDRPGRITEGPDGVVYVALRGAGAVLALDPASGQELSRTAVCKAPRGLSFEGRTGLLHVACAEGRVVTLGPAGAVEREVAVPPDVRDLLVRGSELWLTRFKSAEVLRLDALDPAAEPVGRLALPGASVSFREPDPPSTGDGFRSTSLRMVDMSATVAWRAVPMANGGAVIVHQESADDEVQLSEPSPSGSAYGGGGDGFDGCGGIVRTAVTVLGPDGTVQARDIVAGSPLPVDVAVSPDGQQVAVAHAGLPDPEAPRPSVVFPEGEASGSSGGFAIQGGVTLLSVGELASPGAEDPCRFGAATNIADPVVAVAYTPEGRLVAQTREPPALWVQPRESWEFVPVALADDSRLDTGHEIFHRDSGGGIACASCHPEGGEDGHVWRFSGAGERRSQALHVGLESTAPFHWDGTLETVGALMDEVFVGRMGGVKQSRERLGVLEDWLFGIESPPPMRDAGDPDVARGETLFHSSQTGCATCHAGSALTNNESHAVGTLPEGQRLQVPSLVAVGYRAPFMHDGCAETLRDRFDPACGGSEHGTTSSLTEAQLSDLIAYLESL